MKEYVSTRVGLKRVCVLIDTKWGMKPRDRELIDLMERYKLLVDNLVKLLNLMCVGIILFVALCMW